MPNVPTAFYLGKLAALLERAGVLSMQQLLLACAQPAQLTPAFTRLAQKGKMDTIAEVMHELPDNAFVP